MSPAARAAAARRQCPTCGAWHMTEAQRDAHVARGVHKRHAPSGPDRAERRADLRARLAARAAEPGADVMWAEMLAEHDAEAAG